MEYQHLIASIAIPVILFLTAPAGAAQIRTSPYGYDYGRAAVSANDCEVFIISENDPPRPALVLKPRMTSLAVRASEPVPLPTPASRATEGNHGENKAVRGSSETEIPGPTRFDQQCLLPIYFRFNRFVIPDHEKVHLNRLVSFLKSSPEKSRRVRITGHTCNLGRSTYNNRLSLLRARKIAEYLKKAGIDVAEIRGEGAKRPVSDIRKLNRCVEIEIIQEGGKQSEKASADCHGPACVRDPVAGAGERPSRQVSQDLPQHEGGQDRKIGDRRTLRGAGGEQHLLFRSGDRLSPLWGHSDPGREKSLRRKEAGPAFPEGEGDPSGKGSEDRQR